MHSTSSGDNVFPDAILAILLQMAPLKRSNEMMDCMIRNMAKPQNLTEKQSMFGLYRKSWRALTPKRLQKNAKSATEPNESSSSR